MTDVGGERVRVLRVIARMNAGGPAHHVSLLTGRLDPARFQSLLVCGAVGRGEESLEGLAERHGARLRRVKGLRPEPFPPGDLRALGGLIRQVRRFRLHIVHTHTAKAGTLGRLAALVAVKPRPILVHTFHGDVLTNYFGPARSRVFLSMERALGRVTDRLVAVSFAAALSELAQDPEERRELGSRARERVRETFGADRLLDDVSELYAELLAARAGAGRP